MSKRRELARALETAAASFFSRAHEIDARFVALSIRSLAQVRWQWRAPCAACVVRVDQSGGGGHDLSPLSVGAAVVKQRA